MYQKNLLLLCRPWSVFENIVGPTDGKVNDILTAITETKAADTQQADRTFVTERLPAFCSFGKTFRVASGCIPAGFRSSSTGGITFFSL